MSADSEEVQDVAGNVCEWWLNTDENLEKPKLVQIDDKDKYRVLRGGSWTNSPGGAAVLPPAHHVPDVQIRPPRLSSCPVHPLTLSSLSFYLFPSISDPRARRRSINQCLTVLPSLAAAIFTLINVETLVPVLVPVRSRFWSQF